MMGKTKQSRHFFRTVLILMVIFGLLIASGSFIVVRSVQATFGSPSANLSPAQQLMFNVELFINREKLTKPLDQFGLDQSFSIDQGESVGMICLRLENAGLIPDAEMMRIYLIYTGLDRMLKSGQFTLNPSMAPIQIAADLVDANRRDAIVTILPGWRIEEIAAHVAVSGLDISAESFVSAAYSPKEEWVALLPLERIHSLEGMLFPDMYILPRQSSLDDLMVMILANFVENVNDQLIEDFQNQGLTLIEAVNLASIIEREAVVSDEKPLIASVFFNRLAIGMRLETDPTVQYALGYDVAWQSWWKSPLFISDLSVESPYNTYLIFGLPPGPISNPGMSSLNAVAYPAETPYYFFRAACDGSGRHRFAVTFEEHLNNRCD